jgi:hypothetical protein
LIDGGAINIAVSPDGYPWVVNDKGDIFQRLSNSTWSYIDDNTGDIGVGVDGVVWALGDD